MLINVTCQNVILNNNPAQNTLCGVYYLNSLNTFDFAAYKFDNLIYAYIKWAGKFVVYKTLSLF